MFCPGLKKGTVLLEGKGHFRARNYILRALLRAELHFEGTFVCGIVSMDGVAETDTAEVKVKVTATDLDETPVASRKVIIDH